MDRASLALAVGVVTLVYALYRLLQLSMRDKRLPPGPPILPILGNLHQIPITGLYKKFKEWGEEFGGIYTLKFGPSTAIVLYDRKAIHELVDKKGLLYAERPKSYVADLITGGHSIVFSSISPSQREKRKVVTHNLSPRLLDEKVAPMQDAEITVMIEQILKDPENFYNHIKRTTCSIACALIYGHRGAAYEDFWGHCVYDSLEKFGEALEPGANPPVDEYPFLRHIPKRWAFWKRRAEYAGVVMEQVWTEARRRVDERRRLGENRGSIADRFLDDLVADGGKKKVSLPKHEVDMLFGEMVEGGAETTSSSMLTAVLALAKNRHVQIKAQEELDRVCGAHRMPEWADFDRLPYINCIVKEGIRWRPALSTGIPHRVSQDNWYEGMLIPKDAIIFVPIWSLHHSERYGYDDPFTFNPDRYRNYPKLANDYAGSADYTKRDKLTRH